MGHANALGPNSIEGSFFSSCSCDVRTVQYLIPNVYLSAGKAAPPWDTKSVDWVPTLHLGHEKFQASAAAQNHADRAGRLSKRKQKMQVR